MTAFTELFHTILNMLPFHSQSLVDDAKGLVSQVEADIKTVVEDTVAEVRADIAVLKTQVSQFGTGSVSPADVTGQRQGVNTNPATDPTIISNLYHPVIPGQGV